MGYRPWGQSLADRLWGTRADAAAGAREPELRLFADRAAGK